MLIRNHFKYNLLTVIALMLFAGLYRTEAKSFASRDSVEKSILLRNNNATTLQKIYGDTLINKNGSGNENIKPGFIENGYSPYQDSAYARALRQKLPLDDRISNDLNRFAAGWKIQEELAKGNPWQVAVKNINSLPSEIFLPSGVEQMLYNTNLISSQYVPGIRPLNPGGGLVSLNTIGRWLGLVEDVSPVIKFSLDYTENIEITVYSIQATAVAVLFKGNLPPGSYKYVWNGRDDQGRRMPSGDYIAEVKVGTIKYIRKRIVIP